MKPKSNPFRRSAALAASIVLCLCPTDAAEYKWDTSATAGLQAGSGIWGTDNFWTTDGGTTRIAWPGGSHTATFGGTGTSPFAVQLSTNVATALGTSTLGGLNFTTDGYTLQSNDSSAVRTITIGSTSAAGYITVSSGVTATIGNRVKVTKGSTSGEIQIRGGGTLVVGSGTAGGNASLDGTNGTNTSFVDGGSKLVVTTGGAAKFGSSLVVGTLATGASLEVTGGDLTMAGSGSNLVLGNGGVTSNVSLKMTGGTISFTSSSNNGVNGALRIGGTASSNTTGVVDLDGGTLALNRIYEGTSGTTASTVNLNGGTVKALYIDSADFIVVDNIWVKANGGTIDSNGRAITITKALQEHATSTGGGLTLNDTATVKSTLTLTGTNTYTGTTTIQAGTLKLGTGGSIANSGLIDVRTGATFDVTTAGFTLGAGKTLKGGGSVAGSVTVADTGIVTGGNGTTGTLTIGSLTFSNTGTINVGTLGNYTAAPAVNVTGALTLSGASGAVTINLPTAAVASGTYNLLGFGSGISDATGFTLGTGPTLGSRQSGSGLQYDGTNKLITYTITAVNPIWTGAQSSEWSTNTIGGSSNWKLPDNSPTDFLASDEVVFDDSSSNKTVAISGGADVTPASVTFNNSTGNDYNLQGANGITGTTVLTKSGTGSLTISNANTYTGATSINNGTLVLNGSLGSTAITVVGSATFTQGAAGSIGGSASLTTSGTTTLAGGNTYSGATNINGGSLTMSGAGSLSSSSAITLGGGSLNLGGTSQAVGAVLVTAPAASGDTISNGSLTGTSYAASNTSGDAIISASLLVNGAAGFTMSGTGTVTLSGTNTYTGATSISAGTLKAGSSNAFTNDGVLNMSGTATFDLGGNNASFTNLSTTSGSTITTSGSGTDTDTLTISGLTATSGALFTDGTTRKLAISLNGTSALDPLSNGSNTFSGGLSLLNMRLSAVNNSAITGGRFGKGTITVGSGSQLYMSSAVSISNDFIINANDTVGSRLGSFRIGYGTGVTSTLSGTINASGAVAGFGSDGSAGAILELAGKLTGTNGFNFFKSSGTNAWTAILNNSASNNDYAGTTTIGANTTVKLGTANQIPNGTNTGVVSLAGILDLNGVDETINGLTGAGTVDNVTTGTTNTLTLGDNNATANTFSGLIINTTGSLSLIKIGSGTQTLAGANTFTGGLAIKNGTIIASTVNTALGGSSAGVANGLGTVTLGDTTGTNAASLLVSTTGLNFANPIVLATNGNLSLGNTGTAISTTFSGGVTGNNDLTIISNATTGTVGLTTAAINNVGKVTNTGAGSGTTTISSSIGANVTEVIEDSATSTLSLSGNNSSFLGDYTINNGRMAVGGSFGANAASEFNLGAITVGSNNTTLSVVNSIAVANDINVRAGNSGTKTITLGTSADIVATLSGKVTLDDNLILDATGVGAGASLTLSGNILDGTSGAKGLTKNSAGIVILSGTASDFSGSVAINAGELRIANASALGNSTSITVNAGRLSLDGGITTGSGKSLTTSGNGSNFFGGLQSFSGINEWAGSVLLGANDSRIGARKNATLVVSGAIGDGANTFNLVVRNENQNNTSGAGNATTITELSGVSTYGGNTQLIAGVTRLGGGDNRLPTGTVLQFGGSGANAKFDMNGRNQEVAGLAVMNNGNDTQRDWNANELTNSSGTLSTLTVNTTADQIFGLTTTSFIGSGNYTGIITGKIALVKSGSANLTLSGANTYTDGTSIKNGSLILTGGNDRLLTTGSVALGDVSTSGKLVLGDATTARNQTLAGLTSTGLGGNVVGANATTASVLTLNIASGTNVYGGVLGGGGTDENQLALSKSGSGTLELTGTNTYNGGTTVSAGTLVLANNSAAGSAGISLSGATSALQINSGITVANDITLSNTSASVQRLVADGTAYTVGTSGDLKSSFASSFPDTTATILDGTNSTDSVDATLNMLFSDTSAASNDGIRRSDVFSISGTGSDTFVIQLSAAGLATDSVLGWNQSGTWVNAVTGNTGTAGSLAGSYAQSFTDFLNANGGFNAATMLGAFGFDSGGSSVWAVVNHNSEFAAIPEPTSALVGLLIGAGLLRRRRGC